MGGQRAQEYGGSGLEDEKEPHRQRKPRRPGTHDYLVTSLLATSQDSEDGPNLGRFGNCRFTTHSKSTNAPKGCQRRGMTAAAERTIEPVPNEGCETKL